MDVTFRQVAIMTSTPKSKSSLVLVSSDRQLPEQMSKSCPENRSLAEINFLKQMTFEVIHAQILVSRQITSGKLDFIDASALNASVENIANELRNLISAYVLKSLPNGTSAAPSSVDDNKKSSLN